jgi:chromosomal replication initiator protein
MNLHDFIAEAAAEAGVTVAHILGPQRPRRIAEPRQKAMARAYATGRYSLPQIGRAFDRDHTTVLHACRKAEARGWV